MRACTRRRFVCWLLLAAVIALSVSGCGENEASDELDATAIAATIAADAQEVLSVSDLVAPPAVSFQVVFRQYSSDGNEAYLVWRQGNGRRRWDYVPITREGFDTGHFSLEIDFQPRSHFGDPSLDCGWSTRLAGLGPGEAYVMCSPGGWSSFFYLPVTTALEAGVGERLSDETIVSRRAFCYSLQRRPTQPRFNGAVVCLDSTSGIPLRLEIDDPVSHIDVIAISVSLDEQNLVVPVELQPVPGGLFGDAYFNGTVPMSTLQLPDLSQFGETGSSLRSE